MASQPTRYNTPIRPLAESDEGSSRPHTTTSPTGNGEEDTVNMGSDEKIQVPNGAPSVESSVTNVQCDVVSSYNTHLRPVSESNGPPTAIPPTASGGKEDAVNFAPDRATIQFKISNYLSSLGVNKDPTKNKEPIRARKETNTQNLNGGLEERGVPHKDKVPVPNTDSGAGFPYGVTFVPSRANRILDSVITDLASIIIVATFMASIAIAMLNLGHNVFDGSVAAQNTRLNRILHDILQIFASLSLSFNISVAIIAGSAASNQSSRLLADIRAGPFTEKLKPKLQLCALLRYCGLLSLVVATSCLFGLLLNTPYAIFMIVPVVGVVVYDSASRGPFQYFNRDLPLGRVAA